MSKDPAILFYTGDFLNGCSDLTFEERGQYITLLCLQHQKGHLSEKTIRLTVGSVSVDVLKKFIKDAAGNFYNERMDNEILKRMQFIQSRIDNGSKGGRPKKANGKPYAKPNGKAKNNLPENENINRNDYKDLFKKVLEKNEITLPDKFDQLILEWLKYKSEKSQSYKETGLNVLIKTFLKDSNSDYNTARGMLDYSMSKNYSGLFKAKQNGTNQQSDTRSVKRVNDLWNK
jgi:hypothetical protein